MRRSTVLSLPFQLVFLADSHKGCHDTQHNDIQHNDTQHNNTLSLLTAMFGHLVYVLGRSAGGAKLPSVGLCLNASKAESRLVMATIPLDRHYAESRIYY
jgi:hypothetical protein